MECIFCKIANKSIPAHLVYEDEDIVGFYDQNPQAPTHVLLIPKKHVTNINELEDHDTQWVGRLLLAAKHVAQQEGIDQTGYRLIFNVNQDGGQTVYHIHLHLLGGRHMTWPPG
jgi:histidine triad (HIT) family protein